MFELFKRFIPNRFKTQNIEGLGDTDTKPQHIAVIMDGNGRWANARGLTRVAGHKKGADAVKALIRGCGNNKIRFLTVFAFSSENWNRPKDEVNALMELLATSIKDATETLNENGIRINFIGDLSRFSDSLLSLIDEAESLTRQNDRLVFSVAINYGGRWDIIQACQQVVRQASEGALNIDDIDEDLISEYLVTRGIPDPDLFIRTSGEYRLSNFMLWQSAYAEFYFTDTLWPDFDEAELDRALQAYAGRDRRYGNATDKLTAS